MFLHFLELEASKKAWGLAAKFGGPGLIVLGILDSSAIPTFGGLDLLLILLAAAHPAWWGYYAAMALVGSMIGAYLTYRIARKGGKEALDKKFPKDKLQKVYNAYESHGFWAVFLPSVLPPPFPTSPFLVSAGAMNYPLKNFMVVMAGARAIRYALFGWIGARYGRGLVGFFQQNQRLLVWTAAIVAISAGAAIAFLMWRHHKIKAAAR